MRDSQRYRYQAAAYLRAAQQARDLSRRVRHLDMAVSWLSLARQNEVNEILLSDSAALATAA